MPITTLTRDYSRGHYVLELDNVFGGWLSSADGGYATAMVVFDRPSNTATHKHLAGVKYEDITINCGTGMSKNFFDWIKEVLASKLSPKNGSIVEIDDNNAPISRVDFFNAMIVAVELPALDTTSKDVAEFRIKIAPKSTRLWRNGEKISTPHIRNTQKIWIKSNFRLEIDGLDCSKVDRINSIRIIWVPSFMGEIPGGAKGPAFMDVSNLGITLAKSSAENFYDWHEDFVIKGNNGQDKEKSGILSLLAPNLSQELFKVSFRNLGIFKMGPDKVEGGHENIRRVRAEMYCGEVEFAYSDVVTE